MKTLELLRKPIKLKCPYCDTTSTLEEEDVYVLFRRGGINFTNCKKCSQTFCVDGELKELSSNE